MDSMMWIGGASVTTGVLIIGGLLLPRPAAPSAPQPAVPPTPSVPTARPAWGAATRPGASPTAPSGPVGAIAAVLRATPWGRRHAAPAPSVVPTAGAQRRDAVRAMAAQRVSDAAIARHANLSQDVVMMLTHKPHRDPAGQAHLDAVSGTLRGATADAERTSRAAFRVAATPVITYVTGPADIEALARRAEPAAVGPAALATAPEVARGARASRPAGARGTAKRGTAPGADAPATAPRRGPGTTRGGKRRPAATA